MIGYLKGNVSHLFADYCFIDVQGVGYRVHIPLSTRQQLSVGATASLFTYLNVREDALLLFGFFTVAEYDLFMLLVSVSGVGPKVAMGILSAIAPTDFQRAIAQKNLTLLTKISGIGKKTAERLILELKDKVGAGDELDSFAGATMPINSGAADGSGIMAEALQALLALGYNQSEIMPVLRKISQKNGESSLTTEDFIRQALKEFATGR
ncbi:MAG TPA: Holliday junction branch migration protein RuvA [Patescibacteria group bacterium]|nr:Holliday junction branch migration protein RuvA [Patescibacteria group bacterium]